MFLGNEVDGACLTCLPQARLAKEKQPTQLQKNARLCYIQLVNATKSLKRL